MIHETDVVIVGGGPTGLTAAYLLSRYGIRSTIVERRSTPSAHPRAHMINIRSMELFDAWGIADYVKGRAYPQERLPLDMLAGIGGVTAQERKLFSSSELQSCAQDRVEEGLFELVQSRSEVSTLWAHAVTGVDDRGDHVVVTASGPDGSVNVTGRWVIGCDGSSSTVRNLVGVSMLGDPYLGSLINVWFDGSIMPEGELPPLVSASRNREIKAAFISMDGLERWTFNYFYDPEVESLADFPPERCAELIRKSWKAPDDAPIAVRSIGEWTMTVLVAERFRVGNVFLAGDAAHAFPPTGGFGMNSGVQDAHNLAWKLAECAAGRGSEVLLDSYEAERRPVACFNAIQSLQNADRSDNTNKSDSPDASAISAAASTAVRSASLTEEDEDEREQIEILEHGAAIGMDIGFAYDQSSIIVSDGSTRPDTLVHKYFVNACPGSRAPHLWLKHAGQERSMLTVLEGSFSLVTGADGEPWAQAAKELGHDGVQVVMVGAGCEYEADADLFESTYGIAADGVVLVRPDGHVAFRAASMTTTPDADLAAAFATATGR
jgi:2-polyprenyl-6-methoxyphenol hydroxylase-like FAD-dependent oxidoreductase